MHLSKTIGLIVCSACVALGATARGLAGESVNLAPVNGAISSERTPSPSDLELAERVRSALHSSLVYDGHIDVSAIHGDVILDGIVLDDWDLINAIRIANDAAKPHRVIDKLTIEVAGARR